LLPVGKRRLGDGMRFLQVLTIIMAVLIVAGTTVLLVVIAKRLGGGGRVATPIVAVLDEPSGARIAAIAAAGDRLAVQLQGGGPDRVLLLDPHSGAVVGRIALRGGGP
jgi:hypothetical protein